MGKKKKINNKIFNKTKKNIQKNSEILFLNLSLNSIKESINKKVKDISEIEYKTLIIKNKIAKSPKNVRMESLMEDLPASNLKELEGDFSKKVRYKDLYELHKMNQKSVKIIEEHESLKSKEKILNIELLQKQINILLNND